MWTLHRHTTFCIWRRIGLGPILKTLGLQVPCSYCKCQVPFFSYSVPPSLLYKNKAPKASHENTFYMKKRQLTALVKKCDVGIFDFKSEAKVGWSYGMMDCRLGITWQFVLPLGLLPKALLRRELEVIFDCENNSHSSDQHMCCIRGLLNHLAGGIPTGERGVVILLCGDSWRACQHCLLHSTCYLCIPMCFVICKFMKSNVGVHTFHNGPEEHTEKVQIWKDRP